MDRLRGLLSLGRAKGWGGFCTAQPGRATESRSLELWGQPHSAALPRFEGSAQNRSSGAAVPRGARRTWRGPAGWGGYRGWMWARKTRCVRYLEPYDVIPRCWSRQFPAGIASRGKSMSLTYEPASGERRLRLATSRSPDPPWSRVEGKSQVNLPQMPPLRGGICMGVD